MTTKDDVELRNHLLRYSLRRASLRYGCDLVAAAEHLAAIGGPRPAAAGQDCLFAGMISVGLLADSAAELLDDSAASGQPPRLESLLAGDALARLQEAAQLSANRTGTLPVRISTRSNLAGSTLTNPAAPLAPGPGERIGPAQLECRIGEGAFSLVHRAWHVQLHVPVAVKILRPELLRQRPESASIFEREARLLARLNHPNIVRIFETGVHEGLPYLICELVDGESLDRLVKLVGSLASHRAARLGIEAAEGLGAVASAGLLHRDVKPTNIVVTRAGHAKLVDFGLSLPLDEAARPAGGVSGTFEYISPEQGQGLPCDHRSDIYSLGATLYRASTGFLPFEGCSDQELLWRHAHAMPRPPHELVRAMPAGMSAAILKMMAKRPQDRPQDFAATVELLQPFAEEAPPLPARPSGWIGWLLGR